jgi:hypothetical protein
MRTNHHTDFDLESLKRYPFSAPEGYFDNLEENLRSAVFNPAQEESLYIKYFKPALLLTCSFVMIFGLGHGALKLSEGLFSVNYDEIDVVAEEIGTEYLIEYLYNHPDEEESSITNEP